MVVEVATVATAAFISQLSSWLRRARLVKALTVVAEVRALVCRSTLCRVI